MLAKRITSVQHPLIHHWVNLLKKRSYRQEKMRLIVSGKSLIQEIAKTLPVHCLITLDDHLHIPAIERFLVTETILKKITGLETPDGYAAEISLPQTQNLSSCNRLLIFDQIADPGNLGTLMRTAYALGWEGAVATPGTVDFFNDKAVRAAKGASFFLPYSWNTPQEIAAWKTSFFIADTQGEPLASSAFQAPLALILSNEARGPAFWAERLGKKIFIPMRQEVESLNVASAGAILLYAMRPE